MKKQRDCLTNDEWNAISDLTTATHLDSVFDIYTGEDGKDYFMDFETNELMSLKEGLSEIYCALAYSLTEEGLSEEQAELVARLFIEFGVATESEAMSTILPAETQKY